MSIYKPAKILGSLLFITLLIAPPGLAQGGTSSEPPSPAFVSGEIIVKFRSHAGMIGAQSILQLAGLHLLDISPHNEIMRVQVTPGLEAEAIASLMARNDVEFVTYNTKIYALDTPNDPGFSRQWSLRNTGQTGGRRDADIDAPQAWDSHTGSSQVVIAIVDTGVDLDHEDLQAKIWVNSNEIPGNWVDDDGNGYVDDVNGWDFCNSSASVCDSPQDNDPDDEYNHGSHVAGIAAAAGNNGKGIAGVSWGGTIMPLKVLDARSSGSIYGLQEAIYYAADNGANIINMSLGGGCNFEGWNSVVQPAIDYAVSKNILLVAASGNSNSSSILCPAAMNKVMAVGATNDTDTRWIWNTFSGSNYGGQLAVAAPGEYIYSSLNSGGYGQKTGTSMASPHVAGLAALLWSFGPGLMNNDVWSTIEATTDDLGSVGWDQYYGHGRINARRSLEALVGLQTTPPQVEFITTAYGGPFPASSEVQIFSNDRTQVNWTASISPTVSWLNLSEPTLGTVSATGLPAKVSLVPTIPSTWSTHRVYSTTVIITGTDSTGQALGTRSTKVYFYYAPEIEPIYLPLIRKKAASAPDLTREDSIATSDAVTVTINH